MYQLNKPRSPVHGPSVGVGPTWKSHEATHPTSINSTISLYNTALLFIYLFLLTTLTSRHRSVIPGSPSQMHQILNTRFPIYFSNQLYLYKLLFFIHHSSHTIIHFLRTFSLKFQNTQTIFLRWGMKNQLDVTCYFISIIAMMHGPINIRIFLRLWRWCLWWSWWWWW